MGDTVAFDAQRAHKYFAADCFNKTWDLLDQSKRSAEEDDQLLLRCQASLWHWTQRTDCTPQNLSVGYWLLARVHAVLDRAAEAAQAGEKSLTLAENEPPFYKSYAHEALARAAMVAGDRESMSRHVAAARTFAIQVQDTGEREALEKDLETLKP